MPLFTALKTTSSAAEEPQSKPVKDSLALVRMSSTSSTDSKFDAPPDYKDVVDSYTASGSFVSPNAFAATRQLQIQAVGYDTNQALTGMTLENISVYSVESRELEYLSVRLKRTSNSCALVRGSDMNHAPLIATIYRWGPGRPPRMRILPPHLGRRRHQFRPC